MAVINSITDAIVRLVGVVIIVGVVLGFAISRVDVLNPQTSAAKRRQMDEQTRHQATINSLQEKRVELELEYLKHKLVLDLKLRQIREHVITAAGALALVIIATGVAVLLARFGYRWSGLSKQASDPFPDQSEDVWRSRAYRDNRIQMARANERRFREAFSQGKKSETIHTGQRRLAKEPTPAYVWSTEK